MPRTLIGCGRCPARSSPSTPRRSCTARSTRCRRRSRARTARPVNALLGVSNLVLQAVEIHDPRAVVLCFGEEAAPYRVELYSGYHADRPEMPEELVPQWADAPAYFGAFKWTVDARAQARGR